MTPFKVICVNDAGLPDQLPLNKRVVEGQVYTVIEVARMQLQSLEGYKLSEIDSFFPYEYFKASRFLPLQEEEVAIAEEVNLNNMI
jgi:hypothetical protein